MKKNNYLKGIAFLLFLVLLASGLTACGKKNPVSEESEEDPEDIISYVIRKKNKSSDNAESENINDSASSGATSKTSSKSGTTSTAKGNTEVNQGNTYDPNYKNTIEDIYLQKLKGTTLRLVYWSAPTAREKKIHKEFEVKYSCTIKPEVYTWNQWTETFASMVAAKTVPDITLLYDTYATFAHKQLVQPINDFVDLNDPIWNKEATNVMNYKGKIYAVTTGVEPFMTFWNKDLFQKYGIKEPDQYYKEGKWNFENFKNTAKAMTIDENRDGKFDINGYFSYNRELFIVLNGGNLYEMNDNGIPECTLSKQNALDGLQVLQDITKNGSYDFRNAKEINGFGDGTLAMTISRYSPLIAGQNLADEKKFKFGMCPPPTGPNNDGSVLIYEGGTGVPTGAKNPYGAMAWTAFKAKYEKIHANDADTLTERRKGMRDQDYDYLENYIKNKRFSIIFGKGFGDYWNTSMSFYNDVMYNNKTPAAAVETHAGKFKLLATQVFE